MSSSRAGARGHGGRSLWRKALDASVASWEFMKWGEAWEKILWVTATYHCVTSSWLSVPPMRLTALCRQPRWQEHWVVRFF